MHKYSISLMCYQLNIAGQTYYNYMNEIHQDKQILQDSIDSDVYRTFTNSNGSFGTRMIKSTLARENIIYSRKTIAALLSHFGLSSSYKKSRKPKVCKTNKDEISNLVERDINRGLNKVLTSNLTYVNVNNKHYYVCYIIDVYNSGVRK